MAAVLNVGSRLYNAVDLRDSNKCKSGNVELLTIGLLILPSIQPKHTRLGVQRLIVRHVPMPNKCFQCREELNTTPWWSYRKPVF